MHFIKSIPHHALKISLYEWNQKYIVKFESPLAEQSFKFSQLDGYGQKEIEELIGSSSFLDQVIQQFHQMHQMMAP